MGAGRDNKDKEETLGGSRENVKQLRTRLWVDEMDEDEEWGAEHEAVGGGGNLVESSVSGTATEDNTSYYEEDESEEVGEGGGEQDALEEYMMLHEGDCLEEMLAADLIFSDVFQGYADADVLTDGESLGGDEEWEARLGHGGLLPPLTTPADTGASVERPNPASQGMGHDSLSVGSDHVADRVAHALERSGGEEASLEDSSRAGEAGGHLKGQ